MTPFFLDPVFSFFWVRGLLQRFLPGGVAGTGAHSADRIDRLVALYRPGSLSPAELQQVLIKAVTAEEAEVRLRAAFAAAHSAKNGSTAA